MVLRIFLQDLPVLSVLHINKGQPQYWIAWVKPVLCQMEPFHIPYICIPMDFWCCKKQESAAVIHNLHGIFYIGHFLFHNFFKFLDLVYFHALLIRYDFFCTEII